MKVKRPKLELQRETLRRFGDQTLAGVVGGYSGEDPQPLSSGPSWCGCVRQ